jgi:hypothetical protein
MADPTEPVNPDQGNDSLPSPAAVRRQRFAGMVLTLGPVEACMTAYEMGYDDGRIDGWDRGFNAGNNL